MKVSDLYGAASPLADQDVYIVGTGPSLNVMPQGYLKNRCCVLLNDAQKFFPGLGPIAFSNNRRFLKGCRLAFQVVKARLKFDPHPERDDNHVRWDAAEFHCFSYREPPWDAVSHHSPEQLWAEPNHYWNEPGGSVAIFCLQFVLQCAPRSVHLVGCDCCDLDGREYLGPKTSRGVRHDYAAYSRGLLRMIREGRERFGVPVVSVTPFAGLGRYVSQYQEMQQWRK